MPTWKLNGFKFWLDALEKKNEIYKSESHENIPGFSVHSLSQKKQDCKGYQSEESCIIM